MKNIKLILITVLSLSVVVLSCRDEDLLPYNTDELLSNNGAYVYSTVKRNDSFFNYYAFDTSRFKVDFKVFDHARGEKFDKMDMSVTYGKDQALLQSFTATDLEGPDEDGYLTGSYEISANDLLSKFDGLTYELLEPKDRFTFSWVVTLKDGSTFSNSNSTEDLGSWPFFNSPFNHNSRVTCYYDSTMFVGDYEVTSTSDIGAYGRPVMAESQVTLKYLPIVTRAQTGDTLRLQDDLLTTKRYFSFNYQYQDPNGNDQSKTLLMVLNFDCESVFFDDVFTPATEKDIFFVEKLPYGKEAPPVKLPTAEVIGSSGTKVSCGRSSVAFSNVPSSADYGAFTWDDDNTFTLSFVDNFTQACGKPASQVSYTFTKKE